MKKVHNMVGAGRRNRGQVRNLGGKPVKIPQCQLQPRIIGDSRKMQRRVGGPSQCHIRSNGIVKSVLGHDIPGFQVFFYQRHRFIAAFFGQPDPFCIDSGRAAVIWQRHSQRLRQIIHGVGRKHARTGARSGTGSAFEFI